MRRAGREKGLEIGTGGIITYPSLVAVAMSAAPRPPTLLWYSRERDTHSTVWLLQ